MNLSRNFGITIFFLLLTFAVTMLACDKDEDPGQNPEPAVINVDIESASIRETNENQQLELMIELSEASEVNYILNYRTEDQSAMRGTDYQYAAGDISIPAGQTSIPLPLLIIGDDRFEANESFLVRLFDPQQNNNAVAQAIIRISNDDDRQPLGEDGYQGADAYDGYDLHWGDEFDGTALDLSSWSIVEGDGCPDLCGWGNNELQHYTSAPENLRLEDGKLIFTAKPEETNGVIYSSARINTKDKVEFTYGRIDIRAKMPEGQGIWPALWLLGANVDDVSWPRCGEIDLMELVGHEPSTAHGTVHFGANFESRQSITKATSLRSTKFSDNYHLFSILWQPNAIRWFLDDVLYHEVTSKDTAGANYPFNLPFYLILNIAVGGEWPGKPDQTTTFPQEMSIDYIRVFK